jgi:hypothetical protein
VQAEGSGVAPGGTYVITGSGMSFTATNSGVIIGIGDIQDVINAIRTHAAGANSTMEFGNGTSTLDIGEEYAWFYNSSNAKWGLVTLKGKITSARNQYTIQIGEVFDYYGSISVTSTADIKNTAERGPWDGGNAVYIPRGYLSITGGTVSATSGTAVDNGAGTVNITGGTVSATTGTAVFSLAGTTTVSGTAKVTSANTDTRYGTIYIADGIDDYASLEMTGGTVENTSTGTGNAIRNDYTGVVSITGGTVSKTGSNKNYAVYKGGTGAVTIGPGATIVGNKNF